MLQTCHSQLPAGDSISAGVVSLGHSKVLVLLRVGNLKLQLLGELLVQTDDGEEVGIVHVLGDVERQSLLAWRGEFRPQIIDVLQVDCQTLQLELVM